MIISIAATAATFTVYVHDGGARCFEIAPQTSPEPFDPPERYVRELLRAPHSRLCREAFRARGDARGHDARRRGQNDVRHKTRCRLRERRTRQGRR